MLEVELKASLEGFSPEEIQKKAQDIGFRMKNELREIDMYFNGNDRDFRVTDEALRLRSCQDLTKGTPAQVLITYKGAKQDSVSSTRTEYETRVENQTVMQKLLEALGYRPMYTVDKTRKEFSSGQTTLCLDTVENLGCYLELEMLVEPETQTEVSIQTLLQLLDSLQIPRDHLTRKSYLELIYFNR